MDSEPLLRVTESFLGGMTHSLVLRKSQSKLVAAGFYARVPHSSACAPSSGQPRAALLRAALEPFCKHRDLVDRHRGVPYSLRGCPRLSIRAHGSHSGNVECLLVRSGEGNRNGTPWRRNEAQVSSLRRQHMNAFIGSHVKTPGGVDSHPIAAIIPIERAEIAPVRGRAVRPDVEGQDSGVVGDVESPAIRAEHDSIRANVFVSNGGHDAGRVDVVGATYGEIGAAFPVGNEIVKTSER